MSDQQNRAFDTKSVAAESSPAADEALVPYGYLTSVTQRVDFEQENGHDYAQKSGKVAVPPGTRRVRVVVRAADIGFGKLAELDHQPLGKLYYDVHAEPLSGTEVNYTVTALCRDRAGGSPWWGRIYVEVVCYGV